MILSKTPLRISFFGGGSDLPEFYLKYRGIAVSTTIKKYIHVAVNKTERSVCRAVYSQLEEYDTVEKIQHNRIRETLKHFGIFSNIEIASFSEVSTKGTGLASSSAFTVGLLASICKVYGIEANNYDLAEKAYFIESKLCNEKCGKQDQYSCSFGGFNVIYFNSDNTVEVTPIPLSHYDLYNLEQNLYLVNTNLNRYAKDVLTDQYDNLKKNDETVFENTKKLVDLANTSINLLKNKKIDDFGALLHEGWLAKKSLSKNISNEKIDNLYEKGLTSGALGGKLLGAGAGGYLLFYVPEKNKVSFMEKMKEEKVEKVEFEKRGTREVEI